MCRKSIVLFLIVFFCCSVVFAMPPNPFSPKSQPTEDTTLAVPEAAVSETEKISEDSPKSTENSKPIFPFFHKTPKEEVGEIVIDMYEQKLEERDAELDAKEWFKPVLGVGTFTHFYAEEPKFGAEFVVGVQKGSWSLLGSIGYDDVLSLDDPKKEDIVGRVMIIKSF